MLLSEYKAHLTNIIKEYTKTGLIISSELRVDYRTEKIGLIKGIITFLDESTLFFTEYVNLRYKIHKSRYSFHYQDKHHRMIFRYDNAAHRPALSFQDHKHVGEEIYQSEIHDLQEVLEEIIGNVLLP
jgi:hypothetical protein